MTEGPKYSVSILLIVLVLHDLVGAMKFFSPVKLHSYVLVFHNLYFPFMSTKLPIKLEPWLEKWEKYTLLFPISIYLLNNSYSNRMSDGTKFAPAQQNLSVKFLQQFSVWLRFTV